MANGLVTKEINGFVFSQRSATEDDRQKASDMVIRQEISNGQQSPLSTKDSIIFKTPLASNKRARRSSVGLRGKRVDGMFASPHKSISPQSFYTLIDADMSEPVRMKQLLVWSCMKTMENSSSKKEDLKDVQTDIIKALTSKELNTSWYQRQDVAESVVRDPHPNNMENRKRVKEFQAQLESLSKEKKEWDEIMMYYNEDNARHISQKDDLVFSSEIISRAVEPEFMSFLADLNDKCNLADNLIKTYNSDLTFNAHFLENLLHSAEVASDDMSRSCEHLYSTMLKAYMERESQESKKVDTIQLLSLLSKSS